MDKTGPLLPKTLVSPFLPSRAPASPAQRSCKAVTAAFVDSTATGLLSPRQDIQELLPRHLLCPRIRARAGRPRTLAIAVVFAHGRRISSSSSSCPATPALPDHVHKLHDPETDAAPVIVYVVDDTSSFTEAAKAQEEGSVVS
ncbi:uncharacterized protein LOC119357502 [Triticum dicoccoides]|uniref:uncharacterized protein LOC119357502 n=1 Tax=Triticum dicoccoides TaxID=85692 RepID=UPI00188F4D29|nr:uncharacterized protein LOC119357502 [Triticum dicoccoides]